MLFRSRQLYWSDRSSSNKICFHCGNPAHMIQNCDIRKPRLTKKIVPDAWQQSYNRFQPAGHKRQMADLNPERALIPESLEFHMPIF